MLSLLSSIVLLLASAQCSHLSTRAAPGWNASNFDSFIVFGDSYTDESRLGYFISHNGSAPPPGTLLPEALSTADGGRSWARYVVQYTGQTAANGSFDPQMTLYNYAVSGAVCSNEITPRPFTAINADFPDVVGYEVPAFLADKASNLINTTQPYFSPALTASNAVYVIFIGTNDLGNIAFLTDSQVPGKVLTDYTNCVYSALDALYAQGGRYFILMDTPPLHLTPQYANDTLGATNATQYFPDKAQSYIGMNHTETAYSMQQMTSTVNNVFKYQTPFEVMVSGRYSEAQFAVFDTYQLFEDIYDSPSSFLNGSAPLTVSDFEHHCNLTGQACTYERNNTSPDSFMWYDELHLSEQTARNLAKGIVDTMNGASPYATYWG